MDIASEYHNSKFQTVALDDYTAVKRKPTNNWTGNQRVLLAFLVSHEISWKDVTRLFNACFQNDLINQEGLSIGALSSMHYCMELCPDEEAAVKLLTNPASSIQSFCFESLTKALIKQIAKHLSIQLIPRQPGSIPRPTKHSKQPLQGGSSVSIEGSSKRHTPSKRKAEALLRTPEKKDIQDPTASYPTPSSPTRPTRLPKRARYSKLALSEASPPNQSNPTKPKSLAVLGFRAFSQNRSMGTNGSSGFVAGAFVNTTSRIPLSPNCQSSEYLERANLRKSNPALGTFSFTNL